MLYINIKTLNTSLKHKRDARERWFTGESREKAEQRSPKDKSCAPHVVVAHQWDAEEQKYDAIAHQPAKYIFIKWHGTCMWKIYLEHLFE